MRNINLIPKVPLVRKYFISIIASTVLISAMSASVLLVNLSHTRSTIADKEAEEKQLAATVQAMSQQRKTNALANDVKTYYTNVAKIEAERLHWMPVLELITSLLPNTSRLTGIEVNDAPGNPSNPPSQTQAPTTTSPAKGTETLASASVKIDGEFAGLTQVAEYIVRLQQSPLTESAAIRSIQKTGPPTVINYAVSIELTVKPQTTEK